MRVRCGVVVSRARVADAYLFVLHTRPYTVYSLQVYVLRTRHRTRDVMS